MRLLPDPNERSTTDLVVLAVTALVCLILVVLTVGIVVIELARPEVDTETLIEVESEILAVLVGALVGFIGGRGVGRSERDAPPTPSS